MLPVQAQNVGSPRPKTTHHLPLPRGWEQGLGRARTPGTRIQLSAVRLPGDEQYTQPAEDQSPVRARQRPVHRTPTLSSCGDLGDRPRPRLLALPAPTTLPFSLLCAHLFLSVFFKKTGFLKCT